MTGWLVTFALFFIAAAFGIAVTQGQTTWVPRATWAVPTLLTLAGSCIVWALFRWVRFQCFVWRHLPKIIPRPQGHPGASKTIQFDSVQLADILRQVASLSRYERLALEQMIVKEGMTGAHFYQFIVEQGFPIASLAHQRDIEKVFEGIAEKTTLLDRNYTTGHWSVKPALAKMVQHVLNSDDGR